MQRGRRAGVRYLPAKGGLALFVWVSFGAAADVAFEYAVAANELVPDETNDIVGFGLHSAGAKALGVVNPIAAVPRGFQQIGVSSLSERHETEAFQTVLIRVRRRDGSCNRTAAYKRDRTDRRRRGCRSEQIR